MIIFISGHLGYIAKKGVDLVIISSVLFSTDTYIVSFQLDADFLRFSNL